MDQSEKTLLTFQTRVRQMILQFQKLKKENDELYAELEKYDQRIRELEAKTAKVEHDYQTLKMAKMLQITNGDLQGAKDRIAHLIRDVNKCIAVLSDEK
ncbi:MAG: hypothetical protein J6M25_03195 [Prevotella sp.]|nr:hypothetical protein [Prevotella sp.]